MTAVTLNEERETWRAPAPEPSIPEHAPESAKAIALGFDRVTGGSGRWLLADDEMPLSELSDFESDFGLTLGD